MYQRRSDVLLELGLVEIIPAVSCWVRRNPLRLRTDRSLFESCRVCACSVGIFTKEYYLVVTTGRNVLSEYFHSDIQSQLQKVR